MRERGGCERSVEDGSVVEIGWGEVRWVSREGWQVKR